MTNIIFRGSDPVLLISKQNQFNLSEKTHNQRHKSVIPFSFATGNVFSKISVSLDQIPFLGTFK